MHRVTCAACAAELQFADEQARLPSKCPFCGKTLRAAAEPPPRPFASIPPRSEQFSGAPSRASELTLASINPAPPASDSYWTKPVRKELWPPARWAAQTVAGAFLVLLCAAGMLVTPIMPGGACFGFFLGLCLVATLNGILFARQTRRYTLLAVFAFCLVFMAIGAFLQPGLGFTLQAYMKADKLDKLRELKHDIDHHPNALLGGPARSIVESKMRKHYAGVLDSLATEAGPPADAEFRKAFRALIEDLAKQESKQIVVDVSEEVDYTEPPTAEFMLTLLKATTPKLAKVSWNDPNSPDYPLKNFRDAYPDDKRPNRAAEMADALKRQFKNVLTDEQAQWVNLQKADASPHPRIEWRAKIKNGGQYYPIEWSTFRGNIPIAIASRYEVFVEPEGTWEVRLLDSTGTELGKTSFPLSIPKDAQTSEDYSKRSNSMGTYDTILMMQFGAAAWEMKRRTGLDPGPEPTRFP